MPLQLQSTVTSRSSGYEVVSPEVSLLSMRQLHTIRVSIFILKFNTSVVSRETCPIGLKTFISCSDVSESGSAHGGGSDGVTPRHWPIVSGWRKQCSDSIEGTECISTLLGDRSPTEQQLERW